MIGQKRKVLKRRWGTLPQTGALTELRYAPTLLLNTLLAAPLATNRELSPKCRPPRSLVEQYPKLAARSLEPLLALLLAGHSYAR